MAPVSTETLTKPSAGPSWSSNKRKINEHHTSAFTDTLKKLKEEADSNQEVDEQAVWPRPYLEPLDVDNDAVTFQQIDIEEHQAVGQPPAIRMYGVTIEGHSVCAHIHGFLPYFYIHAPRGFTANTCNDFTNHLNVLFGGRAVHRSEVVSKKSLMGYAGQENVAFIKITISDLRSVPRIRGSFERGEIGFRDLFTPGDACLTYENIAYTLRFMIDLKIVGMNWIRVQAANYRLRPESQKVSLCQIELDCSYDAIVSHAPDDEWSKIAPLRILSFDIECAGRKGVFPEPSVDPVIQIANMVTRQGESTPFVKNVFTLNTCSHIVGSQVLSFNKELDMLEAWTKFVQEVDPDVVIGYNIANFDFPIFSIEQRHSSRPNLLSLVVSVACAPKPKTHTSRRKRTVRVTRRIQNCKDVCNSTCSRSCSVTTSCVPTRSTRSHLSS